MKVSLITVCFNAAKTVETALISVINQQNAHVEYIIIDGGSKDGTKELIQKHQNHVHHFISEPDLGIYDAMNKGIALATGDIIGILNADDFYCRLDVLEQVQQFFLKNPQIDGVYSDLNYVDKNNTTKITRVWKAGCYNPKQFYFGWMPPHPTVFLRKKVYETVGNFNLQFKSAADYEFLLRACLKFGIKLHYLPGTVINMRTGGISNANLKNRFRANAEDRLAWKLNSLNGGLFATLLKPFRKITQYFP